MDGDGLILYLSLLLLAFGFGALFMQLFIKHENKKPELRKEDIEEEIKNEIKNEIKTMSIIQFSNWLKS